MKKSELSFKCVVPNVGEETNLFKELKKIGIGDSDYGAGWCFVKLDKYGISAGRSESDFCNWPEPLMSYEEALKLIESIEPDAPEFDIKPFDRILLRDISGEWSADFYNKIYNDSEFDFVACQAEQMIKYDGNEHLHGTTNTPAGWWECENGKPVWRTK